MCRSLMRLTAFIVGDVGAGSFELVGQEVTSLQTVSQHPVWQK